MHRGRPADAPSDSGVYAICNTATDVCYVGASADVAACLTAHLNALLTDTHGCAALQAAWNTDGEGTFAFTVLELVDRGARLPGCVRHWRRALRPLGLYNNSAEGDDPGHPPQPRESPLAPGAGAGAHVEATYVHINPYTGAQRVITPEECREAFQSRPRLRNVMHRVLARAYMREHEESRVILQSILDDWEQAF